MEKAINIYIRNNGKSIEVPMGSNLEEIYEQSGLELEYGAISARVNNKVEGMHFRAYKQKEVEFLDITSASGLRAYTRTLFFILCKAAHELFDEPNSTPCKVVIDIPISNGYYVDLQLGRPVTPDDVTVLRQKMQDIIDSAIPIHRFETTTEEAIEMFKGAASYSKVKLLKSTGRLFTTYYDIDGYQDYFYGSLLTNTKQIYLFGLEYYFDGLLLRIPSHEDPKKLGAFIRQDTGQDVRHFQGASPVAGYHATQNRGRPERGHRQRALVASHSGVRGSAGKEDRTDSRRDSTYKGH